LIPGLANGGIVYGPTRALIGEAGREVVIPLTRPQRAAELAERSGLLNLLARQGATARPAPGNGGAQVTHNWTIHSHAQDPKVLADHLYGLMAHAAGV
jgi:hypothetical protein